MEACTGFVEEHHIYLLQIIRKDIDQTQTLVDDLSECIKRLLSKYENVLELLREIPGFSTKVVEDLVSEIGLDMSHFPSEKHLSSWAGLSPGNNESAGKKSARITHGNKQVKAVITEAAWAATRTKNTFFSERYHRIAARRGKKRALIAVGHSQLISVYLILSTGARYHELGAQYMQSKIEQKRKVYLSSELKKLGYNVSLTKVPQAVTPN
ncbi:IS110 family transposase [uncultured Bacteroides sp.]|uniref:IS110 family transposase n=1 Tax=uncultured Bacteroides sp. TaxID=162156 RepID=UPI00261AC1F9|nr:IS110 family transposase [uncultured Bacteroides sp.]